MLPRSQFEMAKDHRTAGSTVTIPSVFRTEGVRIVTWYRGRLVYVITDETVLTFVFFRDVIRDVIRDCVFRVMLSVIVCYQVITVMGVPGDVIRDCVLSSDYGDGGGSVLLW